MFGSPPKDSSTMSAFFRMCALFCLLAAPALAQAATPRVGVLVLNDEWAWRAEDQARLKLPAEVVTGLDLLDPAVTGALTPAQRIRLLEDPRRLLASRHLPEMLLPDQILLLGPEVDGRVWGLQVDTVTGARRQLQGPRDKSEREQQVALVEAILAGSTPEPVPVVANPESRMFHKPTSPHLSPHSPAIPLADRSLAEKDGFRACPICFPEANRYMQQDDFERELGRYGAGLIEERYRVSQDPEALARVTTVGKRLMEGNRFEDRGYKFVVLESDEMNAFSVPTGPIYITTGLLAAVETEDELAGVLGHELAHAERHHMAQQYDRDQWVGILGSVLSNYTGSYWTRQGAEFLSGFLSKGFSREFELEADREGVFYTYAAGYRPTDFALTLTKFGELSEQMGQFGPDWFDTHPASEARVEQVNKLCSALLPLETSLASLEGDAELAGYLRRRARQYVEDPRDIREFLDAYGALALPAP